MVDMIGWRMAVTTGAWEANDDIDDAKDVVGEEITGTNDDEGANV